MQNLLQQQYPYTWADNSIPYLGIHCTRSTTSLFSRNYISLRTKIQDDLCKTAKYEFSWWGRLAAFKIIHLPQILYLFTTLPIPIPSSFFKSLQTMLSRYVWNGKKSRCSHAKLIKQRMYGGVGYIGFQDYFSASILIQLKEWFLPSPTTIWGSIESTYSSYGPTHLWLFRAQPGAKIPSHLPLTRNMAESSDP